MIIHAFPILILFLVSHIPFIYLKTFYMYLYLYFPWVLAQSDVNPLPAVFVRNTNEVWKRGTPFLQKRHWCRPAFSKANFLQNLPWQDPAGLPWDSSCPATMSQEDKARRRHCWRGPSEGGCPSLRDAKCQGSFPGPDAWLWSRLGGQSFRALACDKH